MTWLLGIKIYASASLLFTATWCWAGHRFNKRREAIRTESRWSRVIEHDCSELPAVIRARAEELIL